MVAKNKTGIMKWHPNATNIHNTSADQRWLVSVIRVLMKKEERAEAKLNGRGSTTYDGRP